jgi:hypothetical protein
MRLELRLLSHWSVRRPWSSPPVRNDPQGSVEGEWAPQTEPDPLGAFLPFFPFGFAMARMVVREMAIR